MAEITVTKENFENEVIKSDKPVLLDFWASWCGPCKMLAPVIAEIAEEYAEEVKVGKVNVDEQEELAAAAGISRQSIIAIEKGRFNPSLEAAIRIARCFGVPVEAVFFPEADGWRCRPETGEGRLIAGQGARELAHITYGGYPLRYNGGEVVAACNAMTLLGAAVSPEDVAGEFEDNGMPLLGGALGTDPRRLPDYFAAHGVTCTPCRRDRLPGEGVFLCSYAALPLLREVRGVHTVALRVTAAGAAVWNERDGDTEPALYPDMPSFLKGKALAALYLLRKE